MIGVDLGGLRISETAIPQQAPARGTMCWGATDGQIHVSAIDCQPTGIRIVTWICDSPCKTQRTSDFADFPIREGTSRRKKA